MEKEIRPNILGVAYTKVTIQNTAQKMKSGDLDVFATPAMVALMEEAAATRLRDFANDVQTSVGISISVQHTRATRKGSQITAKAIVERVEGNRVDFSVKAFDDKGEICHGTHTRVIINKKRFLEKLS